MPPAQQSPDKLSLDSYERLEQRLKTLLPEQYQESYEDVQPVSMGSAGLKFGSDGRVAWDEIWGSFCDLAMAGGPPHRGKLLEPATKADIDSGRARYREVVSELCRGIEMTTGLAALPSLISGWVHVDCPNTAMAGWLARAINMENVSAHVNGMVLHLPAGPGFRLEKEIKNVIVSIAKTCHYWAGHTSVAQHRAIANLFAVMDSESPLIQPPFSTRSTRTAAFETARDKAAAGIHAQTGLQTTSSGYHGWLGVHCPHSRAAIWIMRMMVAGNAFCRREGDIVYVPINPATDRNGDRIATLLARTYRLAVAQGVI